MIAALLACVCAVVLVALAVVYGHYAVDPTKRLRTRVPAGITSAACMVLATCMAIAVANWSLVSS